MSDRPERPILIYDGDCGFCRRWVARLERIDRRGVVEVLALQDARAPLVSGRPREALRQAAHLVRPDGCVLAGAAAAREVLRHVPGGWLVWGALGLPGAMPLAERAYVWIARRWGPLE